MDTKQIKFVIEAALLAAGRPLNLDTLKSLFGKGDEPTRQDIRRAIVELQEDYSHRGIMLSEVASGYRIQVKTSMSTWLAPLWAERPPRYSRALMETLAIIAYRQPITRGEIEEIRGVSVTTNIMRTLLERTWVRIVGHRDVPGKPAMFATTREFLDYFGLKKLEDLPPLSELQDIENLNIQLPLQPGEEDAGESAGSDTPLVAAVDSSMPAGPASVANIDDARAASDDSGPSEDQEPQSPRESAPDAESAPDTASNVVPLPTN